MGLSASIDAPHDTQRRFEGTGEFFAPQEGQVSELGDFAAAAMLGVQARQPALKGQGRDDLGP
jgi:hypothetical protein